MKKIPLHFSLGENVYQFNNHIYHKYTTNINALNFIVYLFFFASLSKKNYCSETEMIILSAPSGIFVT